MTTHPDEAAKVRAANRSYVFFRITGLSNEGEPIGAQGVPLTPGRSIAVDRAHEYGTPFFIEANLPIESGKSVSPFRRLMIAQDTGSAIVGPTRADLYWGAGDDAGRIASRIRHPGRFVMLVPREFDIAVAGSEIPLPVPKPKTAELEITKRMADARWVRQCRGCGRQDDAVAAAETADRRAPSRETEPQRQANSANAGATAIGGQKPSPARKVAALEVRRQDRTGNTNSANAGAIPIGQQKPSPAPSPKVVALKGGKQDRTGNTNSANANAIAVGVQKPTPAPSPKVVALEVGIKDSNGKANSANAGAMAIGRQKPTPKIAAIEVKKHGKGKAKSAIADAVAAGERLHRAPAR